MRGDLWHPQSGRAAFEIIIRKAMVSSLNFQSSGAVYLFNLGNMREEGYPSAIFFPQKWSCQTSLLGTL